MLKKPIHAIHKPLIDNFNHFEVVCSAASEGAPACGSEERAHMLRKMVTYICMLTFSHLSQIAGIQHGITQVGEQPPTGMILGTQVHKDKAVWVEDSSKKIIKGVDALVTRTPNIVLGSRTADCVPILFVEPRMKIIGAIHAGWRGTALDITRKTIEFLKIKPFQLLVGIGPAICPKCFEVGPEVARQFDASVKTESQDPDKEGKWHIDLWQANINQCIEAGIPERNIEVLRMCTFEDHSLYSFRRGDRTDHNFSFISLL